MACSALLRTREFFLQEMDIRSVWPIGSVEDVDQLVLHDVTAIVGVRGINNIRIAVSFEQAVLDEIMSRYTADISVPANQTQLYRRETAAEIVNILVGHCTIDFQKPDMLISLTPPVIVERPRSIQRPAGAVFKRLALRTEFGPLDINFVGPGELLDEQLQYVKTF